MKTVMVQAARISVPLFFAMVSMGQSLRESYADLPGARLFYVDSGGRGQPIVFLHAATGSVPMWEHQIQAVTKAGYRFIAYDRRGWGKSTLNADGAQPGTAADDLAALLNHLKIDRAHVVGTAAGGFAAIDFALSFPSRIRSLVVACSIGGIQDDEYQKLGQWLRPAPTFEALPAHLRELGPAYRAANRQGAERWMELEHASRPPGPRAGAQTMKNRLTLQAMETLKLPALAIAGGADLYAPPEAMRMYIGRVRGAKLVVIPDSGHSAYWESPEAFNQAVLDFVRRVK